MSYNIFVNSSIHNFGSHGRMLIEEELNKVKNPKWHTTENLDIEIEEDYDMRHIEAIQRASQRFSDEQEKKYPIKKETPIEILGNAIAEYAKDFETPNTIKMNSSTLNRLKQNYHIYYNNVYCNAPNYGELVKIFGMDVKIDNELRDNNCIIYNDKNIYIKVILE